MKEESTILIADKNPHIREFLRRELTGEGYRVRVARNCKEVLKWAYGPEPIHLLILDLDLPDEKDVPLLKELDDRVPAIPVVLHTFASDYATHCELPNRVAYVEKVGNSIERLKEVISEVLKEARVQRSHAFDGKERDGRGAKKGSQREGG
ncbi:MAG: response regulator [Pseudomonadota bacterium]